MKKRTLNHSLILLFFAIILVVSCDKYRVAFKDYSVPNGEWHKDSVITLVSDSLPNLSEPIGFQINLRHNIDYEYRNIWLFVSLQMPNGTVLKDTLEKVFMLPTGEWMEDVTGSGAAKESVVNFKYGVKSPEPGVYSLSVQHGMRSDVISGILNVGFKINTLEKRQ